MSALQFLNKKSWHVSTIKNNEKVWLKEQQAAKEKSRMEELQKQLAEERKLEQIQRLEEQSGRLDPAQALKRRRLNWMYDHPSAVSADEKEREEVMLGKREIDLSKLNNHTKNLPPVLVDAEAKLREDPLVFIKQQRAQALRRNGLEPSLAESSLQAARRKRKEARRAIREQRRRRRQVREQSNNQSKLDNVSYLPETSLTRDPSNHTPSSRQYRQQSEISSRENDEPPQTGRYGLHVPLEGSGVAIKTDFVPRRRDARTPSSSRRPPARGGAPTRPMDAEEKRRRLEQMEEDAERMDRQRRDRLRRDAQLEHEEARDYERRFRKRDSRHLGSSYARETFTEVSAADRILQRRAWSARDGDASY